MDPKIEIRRAAFADAEAITNVARLTWDSAYADIILPQNRESLLRRWYAPDALKDSIRQDSSWFYIAQASGMLVGFAQYVVRQDKSAYLTRIYVLPGWQRRGIGTLLHEGGLKALVRESVHDIVVQVEKDNRIGKAFYDKKGFQFSRELSMELPDQNLILEEIILRIAKR